MRLGSNMDDLIKRLDQWLNRYMLGYYNRLEPGLNPRKLSALESRLGNKLPAEMRDLLKWRNGQSTTNFDSIYYNYMLIGSDEIVETVEENNELAKREEGEFKSKNWWSSQWVPFIGNGAGDYYCIDFAGSFNGVPGQIIEYNHDYEGRTIHFRSFRHWLQTLVDGLAEGRLEYGQYGMQPNESFEDLYESINPGYPKRRKAR